MKIRTILTSFCLLLFPFHPDIGIGINISLADPIIGLLFFLIVVSDDELPIPIQYIYLLLLFMISCLFIIPNILIHSYPGFSTSLWVFDILKLFGTCIWAFGIYFAFQTTVKNLYKYALLVAGSGICFSLLTLTNVFVNNVSRPPGPFGDPNLYANYLLLVFFLIIFLIYKGHNDNNLRIILLGLGALVVLGTIFTTASRSAVLGLVGVAFFATVLFLSKCSINKRNITLIIGIPLTFIAMLFLTGSNIIHRFQGLTNDYSFRVRIELWEIALNAFIQHPLTGIGYGQYPGYSTPLTELARISYEVHNTYLSVATELGLIGFILFSLIFVYIIRQSLFTVEELNTYIHIPILFYVISSMGQGIFINIENFRSLWIGFAFLSAILTKTIPNNVDS